MASARTQIHLTALHIHHRQSLQLHPRALNCLVAVHRRLIAAGSLLPVPPCRRIKGLADLRPSRGVP